MTGRVSSPSALSAHLGDVGELYNLALDKNSESRGELTRKISKVLEATLSPRESELVADILIELLRQAEKDLRQSLAEQLSVLDDVPLRLILQLANDEIDVASPILASSSVLGEFDLLYIIKSKPADYWRAIAKRKTLSDQVINVLSDTKDFETALNLVENLNITLTEDSLVILSDIAQGNEALAVPLSSRDELSKDLAKQLYVSVGADVKRFIEENFEEHADTASEIIDQTVEEITEEEPAVPNEFLPADYMMNAAQSFKEKDMLNVKLMMETLRREQLRSFIAQFSVYTGFSTEVVVSNMMQANGRGLAVISKASGIGKQDFVSLFMLVSKVWNHGRLVGTQDIQIAVGFYNSVTQEAAKKMALKKVVN